MECEGLQLRTPEQNVWVPQFYIYYMISRTQWEFAIISLAAAWIMANSYWLRLTYHIEAPSFSMGRIAGLSADFINRIPQIISNNNWTSRYWTDGHFLKLSEIAETGTSTSAMDRTWYVPDVAVFFFRDVSFESVGAKSVNNSEQMCARDTFHFCAAVVRAVLNLASVPSQAVCMAPTRLRTLWITWPDYSHKPWVN